jgi:hypothetical protein
MSTHRGLCFLLAFILLMASPTVTTARDVCAPGLIPSADATKICEQVCAGAQPLSQWNGQWNNDSPTCHWLGRSEYLFLELQLHGRQTMRQRLVSGHPGRSLLWRLSTAISDVHDVV